jgi:hypothetical protein
MEIEGGGRRIVQGRQPQRWDGGSRRAEEQDRESRMEVDESEDGRREGCER